MKRILIALALSGCALEPYPERGDASTWTPPPNEALMACYEMADNVRAYCPMPDEEYATLRGVCVAIEGPCSYDAVVWYACATDLAEETCTFSQDELLGECGAFPCQ